ncbi:MAG: YciI family protein [Myxococcota bacterium]
MADYLLLYKGGDPNFMDNTTPEQMKEMMDQWGAWFKRLEEGGNLRNPGAALGPESAVVSQSSVTTDQALAEVKELVGGFTIIAADSLEQAAELAKGSPHLATGPHVTVDVRPVLQM